MFDDPRGKAVTFKQSACHWKQMDLPLEGWLDLLCSLRASHTAAELLKLCLNNMGAPSAGHHLIGS